MTDQTTTWYCDNCGELIEQAEHGWVEWIDFHSRTDGVPSTARDIRIVHHFRSPLPGGSCQYIQRLISQGGGGGIGDDSLTEFQGKKGLRRLNTMKVERGFPPLELEEVIKRIHTPGYEHSRQRSPRHG